MSKHNYYQSLCQDYRAPLGSQLAAALADMYFIMDSTPRYYGSRKAARFASDSSLALDSEGMQSFHQIRKDIMLSMRERMWQEMRLICGAELDHVLRKTCEDSVIEILSKYHVDAARTWCAAIDQYVQCANKQHFNDLAARFCFTQGIPKYVKRWKQQRYAESITGLTTFNLCLIVFNSGVKWSELYGGEAWREIAHSWKRLAFARSFTDVYLEIDAIAALEHNTASLFDKCGHVSVSSINRLLDARSLASSISALQPYLSPWLLDWFQKHSKDPSSHLSSGLPAAYYCLGDGRLATAADRVVLPDDPSWDGFSPKTNHPELVPHPFLLPAESETGWGEFITESSTENAPFDLNIFTLDEAVFHTKPTGIEVRHCSLLFDQAMENIKKSKLLSKSFTTSVLGWGKVDWEAASLCSIVSETANAASNFINIQFGDTIGEGWRLDKANRMVTTARKRMILKNGDSLRFGFSAVYQSEIGVLLLGCFCVGGDSEALYDDGYPFTLDFIPVEKIRLTSLRSELSRSVSQSLTHLLDSSIGNHAPKKINKSTIIASMRHRAKTFVVTPFLGKGEDYIDQYSFLTLSSFYRLADTIIPSPTNGTGGDAEEPNQKEAEKTTSSSPKIIRKPTIEELRRTFGSANVCAVNSVDGTMFDDVG